MAATAEQRRRAREVLNGTQDNRTQRNRDGNRSLLATWKIESGCVDCGYNDDPVALDFDHVRGEKLFGVGDTRKGRALHLMVEEAEKCVVRCANCHRIKTRERRDSIVSI